MVLAFVASFGLTIGLLTTSDQPVLDAVVWPGMTLRLMFFLSEILQVGVAFVFARTVFKHGLNPRKVVPVAVVLFLTMCMGWIPLFSEDHATVGTSPVPVQFQSTLQLCVAQGFGFSVVSSLFLANEVGRGFCKKPKKSHVT